MNRLTKGIFGGFLAVLAAFGWVVAILFLLVMKGVLSGVAFERGFPAWIILVLIIAAGFYMGFRAAYEAHGPNAPPGRSLLTRERRQL